MCSAHKLIIFEIQGKQRLEIQLSDNLSQLHTAESWLKGFHKCAICLIAIHRGDETLCLENILLLWLCVPAIFIQMSTEIFSKYIFFFYFGRIFIGIEIQINLN